MIANGRRNVIATGAVVGLVVGAALLLVGQASDADNVQLLPVDSGIASAILHLIAGAVLGATIAGLFESRPGGHASMISNGVLTGLLWWIVGPLSLTPILDGSSPRWTLAEAGNVFPNLIASLLFGAASALVIHVTIRSGLLPGLNLAGTTSNQPAKTTRVVVLGGGFGGVAVAKRFEQMADRNPHLDVTLVSPSNFLLFTPMLAEVVGSSLEPQHISAPIRAAVPRTRFVRSWATGIDTQAQVVRLSDTTVQSLPYDHLVLAMGSVPNYRDLAGMAEHSFSLKSLDDATILRNHVITMMERADHELDAEERQRMLTFVVAGGGFAGTETVAEIFDLAFSALRYYPRVPIGELRFVLVHTRDRILPEISPELADYALTKLKERGIEFLLETSVAGATADSIQMADGTEIQTRTVVWTAGNQPNPLLRSVPGQHNRAGALLTHDTLQIVGHNNIWGVGDNAQIPDPDTEGGFYPPTAQHALREGKKVADNIAAVSARRSPQPFRFKTLGVLVALGHRTAAAEIRGWRFSGLLAWMMWRAIYLAKLPGIEKKIRVLFDWTVDLFFPRDIVLTDHISEPVPEAYQLPLTHEADLQAEAPVAVQAPAAADEPDA